MKKILLLSVVFVFTFSSYAQTPIQEFNFNGTLNNVKNDVSFSGNVEYVKDKSGVLNSAIRLVNGSIETPLINLPLVNSSRTISIWVKYNDLTNSNYIWGYEPSHSTRYFAMVQQSTKVSTSDLNLTGYDNNVIVSTTVIPNVWYHYVVTYNGLTLKIYRNGVLLKSSLSSRKLSSGVIFSIGKMGKSVSINADIDDLKIYNVALTENEVKVLYNNSFIATNNSVVENTPGSTVISDKQIDSKMLKSAKENNPKVMTANSEIMDVTKTSEIFSTKGLKVFSGKSNSIDIGSLPEGTYLLKITNTVQNSAVNN